MAQTRRLLLYTLPLALFIVVTLLLYSGIGKDPTLLDSQMVGKVLPSFNKTRLLHPEQHITNQDIQGPALINVWGTWCPACYHEHPFILKLAREDKVVIYGLNYNDKRADSIAYLEKMGNPYKAVIFDENNRLMIDMGVYGAPETFVIDKNNRIVYRHVGVVTEGAWQTKIKPALAPTPAKKSSKAVPPHPSGEQP